jgi:hypothetical protein
MPLSGPATAGTGGTRAVATGRGGGHTLVGSRQSVGSPGRTRQRPCAPTRVDRDRVRTQLAADPAADSRRSRTWAQHDRNWPRIDSLGPAAHHHVEVAAPDGEFVKADARVCSAAVETAVVSGVVVWTVSLRAAARMSDSLWPDPRPDESAGVAAVRLGDQLPQRVSPR